MEETKLFLLVTLSALNLMWECEVPASYIYTEMCQFGQLSSVLDFKLSLCSECCILSFV